MEQFVLLMALTAMKEEWRYAAMEFGEQHITVDGIPVKEKWSVNNLDSKTQVLSS